MSSDKSKSQKTNTVHLSKNQLLSCDKVELNKIGAEPTRLNLCKVLLQAFENLLNYIEAHFTKYFDQDQKIPDTYAHISVKEFREKLEVIRKLFVENGVDKEFTELVLFPVNRFVETPEKKNLTFRSLIYKKYLVKELIALKDKPNFSEAVFEHLF
jgi:hypothetical protein